MEVKHPHTQQLRWLESRLLTAESSHERLGYLRQLIPVYLYQNIPKASELLDIYQAELSKNGCPDEFRLDYFWQSALLHNQLYKYREALSAFYKAENWIQTIGAPNQKAAFYIDYAGTMINLHRLDEALRLLSIAKKWVPQAEDTRFAIWLNSREGVLHLHAGNDPEALRLLLESDKQFSQYPAELSLKDYHIWALVHGAVGSIYQRMGAFLKSIDSNLQAVHICQKTGMHSRLSYFYLNVGRGYMAYADIENAQQYLRMAIATGKDSSIFSTAGAHANLGFCAYLQGDYEEALRLYDYAETLYKTKQEVDNANLFTIDSWRARLYLHIGETDRAEECLVRAFKYAHAGEDYKNLATLCQDLADYYAGRSDYANAYEYLQLHNEMKEKYQSKIQHQQLVELEFKYETEKRKKEAELLRLQASRLQMKALRAQMNPHFMSNALNSIQHFIQSNTPQYAIEYLAKFAKLMRQSLNFSDRDLVSLEEEASFLRDYLLLNKELRFPGKMGFSLTISEEVEEDIMHIPGMIVQPYVENAIEHGIRSLDNGFVKVHFDLVDELNLICTIEDNGIGRDQARRQKEQLSVYNQGHKSMATTITQDRLELLHQNRVGAPALPPPYVRIIDLFDETEKQAAGTRVEVIIPIFSGTEPMA